MRSFSVRWFGFLLHLGPLGLDSGPDSKLCRQPVHAMLFSVVRPTSAIALPAPVVLLSVCRCVPSQGTGGCRSRSMYPVPVVFFLLALEAPYLVGGIVGR